jgi:hypothetical protein
MAAPIVTSTATATCSFGSAPATLTVLPATQVLVEGNPAATIADSAAVVNLPPFGMCSSLSNPAVATATSAASGTLTPQACTPLTMPWLPGVATVVVGGKPIVNANCKTACSYGGVVTIVAPGSAQTLG